MGRLPGRADAPGNDDPDGLAGPRPLAGRLAIRRDVRRNVVYEFHRLGDDGRGHRFPVAASRSQSVDLRIDDDAADGFRTEAHVAPPQRLDSTGPAGDASVRHAGLGALDDARRATAPVAWEAVRIARFFPVYAESLEPIGLGRKILTRCSPAEAGGELSMGKWSIRRMSLQRKESYVLRDSNPRPKRGRDCGTAS